MGPMRAIRKHHPNAHITLMTTDTFAKMAQKCGYFNEIWHQDTRPKSLQIKKWIALRHKLISTQYDRVYDLQNNDRTNLYFKLFPKSKRPEWVGTAKGASHSNKSPDRIKGHAFDGHKQTLGLAGIKNIEVDTMHWMEEDVSSFQIPSPYILLIPGCAPQHPYKRWPAEKYAQIANHFIAKKKQSVVLIGTNAEKDAIDQIEELCPKCINLTGKTSLFHIATLAKNAHTAIGNDTGPMHIIGPTECPSIVLFSKHGNINRHYPLGKNVKTIQKNNIADIEVSDVIKAIENYSSEQ